MSERESSSCRFATKFIKIEWALGLKNSEGGGGGKRLKEYPLAQ